VCLCGRDKSALFLSDAISYLGKASYPGGNVYICMASKVGLELVDRCEGRKT